MTTSWPKLSGKHAAMAALLVIIPLLPTVLLSPLGLGATIGSFALGAMAGLFAAILVSARFALLLSGLMGVVNFLAVPASSSIVLSGILMAAASLLYGLTYRRGIGGAVVMGPLAVVFTLAMPPQPLAHQDVWANALVVGAVTVIGALWGAGMGRVLARFAPHHTLQPIPVAHAVMFAVTIAVVTGVTMGFVIGLQLQHGGAWILLTILMVSQPALHQTWRKTCQRVVGTALGFLIVLVLSLLHVQNWSAVVLGLVFMAAAVYIKLDSTTAYWQFAMFLTPAIVLLEGASTGVVTTDVARLVYTLIGAAVALGVVVVYRLVAREKHRTTANTN
jgi:hypothetical protein